MITSEEVYRARYDARLTQREAAMLIGVSKRTWESWESVGKGHRNMPDCKLILFRLRTPRVTAPQVTTVAPQTPAREPPP